MSMGSRRTVRHRGIASASLRHSLLRQCAHHPVPAATSPPAIIHQPIASLTEGAALGHLGDPVLLADGSPSKLCASPHYSARASRDVESLADGLWKTLGSSICEGRFSYRGGIWQEFDADDLTFIRHALENLLEP